MNENPYIVYKSRSRAIKTAILFTFLALLAYILTTSINFSAIWGIIALIYFAIALKNNKILKLDTKGIHFKNKLLSQWYNFRDVTVEERAYSAGEGDYIAYYINLTYYNQNIEDIESRKIEITDSFSEKPEAIVNRIRSFHYHYTNSINTKNESSA